MIGQITGSAWNSIIIPSSSTLIMNSLRLLTQTCVVVLQLRLSLLTCTQRRRRRTFTYGVLRALICLALAAVRAGDTTNLPGQPLVHPACSQGCTRFSSYDDDYFGLVKHTLRLRLMSTPSSSDLVSISKLGWLRRRRTYMKSFSWTILRCLLVTWRHGW